MGLYINPPGRTKEDWLREHGALMVRAPKEYKITGSTGTYWAVVLLFNPTFTAAGVAYSQRELEEFDDPTDLRTKLWYIVEQEDLLSVVPDLLAWEKEAQERGRW